MPDYLGLYQTTADYTGDADVKKGSHDLPLKATLSSTIALAISDFANSLSRTAASKGSGQLMSAP